MTAEKLLEELRVLFGEVFHVQPHEVTSETQFGELPQWDSMGHMDLMVALETKYGVEISAETISRLTSVAAIISHVEAQSNGR